MKSINLLWMLLLTTATLADVSNSVETEVLVIRVEDADLLMEQRENQEQTTVNSQSRSEEPAPAPAPETRIIEMNPAPVVVVNRTHHFRFISRQSNEKEESVELNQPVDQE